jgi:hypothetical protein
MINVSRMYCAGLITLLALAARPAMADYQYTFDSSYGALQFTSASIIPADSGGPFDLTFTEGSGSLSFTQDSLFSFKNGATNSGTSYSIYSFAFTAMPLSVGHYETGSIDSGSFVFIFPPVGGAYTAGTLDITTLATLAVPEPSTWVMLLAGFAGLGHAGYRRRQKLAGTASI